MNPNGAAEGRMIIISLVLLFSAAITGLLLPGAAAADRDQAGPGLNSLLERAAKYCDKLSRSVLDFACRERIEEWFHPEAQRFATGRFPVKRIIYVGRREKHAYLYDFQLIRDRAGSIRESRILLKEDKKAVHVVDAPLKTRLFWHAYVVMGPLGLLSRERQADHDYRIVGEEKVGRERAVIIEAVTKAGVHAEHLVGKIWLGAGDAGVLKIEWDPSSIANYVGVEEAAKRFQMDPRIVMTSEYAFEKNGIRFPSRYTVQEIYASGRRRFQRSQTDVFYDEYKFFTVETEVIY